MEALGASKHGDYSMLESLTLVMPKVESPSDVLIQVAFSDVNPVDLQKLSGNKPVGTPMAKIPFVPGFGGSGTVMEVGGGAPAHWKGKEVCFLGDPTRQGSYGSHVVVDHRCVALLPPSGVELREAACVPIAGLTAFECLAKVGLVVEKRIQDGKLESVGLAGSDDNTTTTPNAGSSHETGATKNPRTLLVIGGAGGVGSWVITLARAWHPNMKIIATASTPEQQEWCKAPLGANEVFRHEEIRDKLPGGTDGSVDAIICLAEPTTLLFSACAEVIKPYGRICLAVAGKSIESLDLSFLFFKCATVSMETIFSSIRTKYQHIVPADELSVILQLLSKQTIQAPLSPDLDSGVISERFKDALKEEGVLCALSKPSGRRGKLVMRIQAEEAVIFLDLKTSSILPISRQDCIKAKILSLTKDDDGKMVWKEQTSSNERDELIKKIVKHKGLGIVKVAGKQWTDYEDGLEMQEAENVKNLWGVQLKKRTKNVEGEEFLFVDPRSGALGEVSRKNGISAGVLVVDKADDGKETVKGAVTDFVERDEFVQAVRQALKLNLEPTK